MVKHKQYPRKGKSSPRHTSSRRNPPSATKDAVGPGRGGGKSTSGVLQARPPNAVTPARSTARSPSTKDYDSALDDDDIHSGDTEELIDKINKAKRPAGSKNTPQKGRNKKKNCSTAGLDGGGAADADNPYDPLVDTEDEDMSVQPGETEAICIDDGDDDASRTGSVIFVEPRPEYHVDSPAVESNLADEDSDEDEFGIGDDEDEDEDDASYNPEGAVRDVALDEDQISVNAMEIQALREDAQGNLNIDPINLHSARLSRSTGRPYVDVASDGVIPLSDGRVEFDEPLNRNKTIRYKAIIPGVDAVHYKKSIAKVLKSTLKAVQDEGGKAISLAAWDFKNSPEIFSKGTDMPTGDGSKKDDLLLKTILGSLPPKPKKKVTSFDVWINLHFITASPDTLSIDLPDLGYRLVDELETVGLKITKSPHHMQCAKHSSLICLLYSNQSMDADKVCDELRRDLKINSKTIIGAQWRRVKRPDGRMYEFPDPDDRNKNPPPQAIHIDCETSARLVLMKALMKRFHRKSRHRLLGQKVRAIPCFTSFKGPALKKAGPRPGAKEPPAATMVTAAVKQRFFINDFLVRIHCPELVNPDYKLPDRDGVIHDARSFIMAQHPPCKITARLCIGIMPHWRDEGHVLLAVQDYVDVMESFMVSMIPQSLYLFGPDSARWWSPDAIDHHADDKWDPKQGLTVTNLDFDDDGDDIYGLSNKWKNAMMTDAFSPSQDQKVNAGPPSGAPPGDGATVGEMLANRNILANDDQSLGDYVGRDHDGDTVVTAAPPPAAPDPTTKVSFDFVPDEIATTLVATNDDHSTPRDAGSVSTMGSGFTTESTRRNLRHERMISAQLRDENQEIEAERAAAISQVDALRAMLQAAGISADAIDAQLASSSSPQAAAPHGAVPGTGVGAQEDE